MKHGFLVVLSGGLDSTVLLWSLNKRGMARRALTVDYGQRHHCEIAAAKTVADMANVPHDLISMANLGRHLPGSSQTDTAVAVPDGHYADETMRATVVPNRNMVLLSVALAVAVAHDLEGVAYGAHAGDHAIYPDCRPAFVGAMREAAKLCDYKARSLIAPFVSMSKADIVQLGDQLGAPMGSTWTCYRGGRADDARTVIVHCGTCGACRERREAFISAGVEDPTSYEV